MAKETWGSQVGLAIIVAVSSFVATLLANYIDSSWLEYNRATKQLSAQRRDVEIKSALIEIDNFISEYNKFKSEAHVILKNFSKSNIIDLEDFYSPLMNMNNIGLNDNELQEKVNNLARNITPLLQADYIRLTTIHKVPLSADMISTVNGINIALLGWFGNKEGSTVKIPDSSYPIWHPEKDLILPPREPGKFSTACMNRLNEQIKALTEMRTKVISGDY